MALVPSTLQATLLTIFNDVSTTTTAAQKATSIANAIDTYIKSATITVETTGTASAQAGIGIIS